MIDGFYVYMKPVNVMDRIVDIEMNRVTRRTFRPKSEKKAIYISGIDGQGVRSLKPLCWHTDKYFGSLERMSYSFLNSFIPRLEKMGWWKKVPTSYANSFEQCFLMARRDTMMKKLPLTDSFPPPYRLRSAHGHVVAYHYGRTEVGITERMTMMTR